MLATTFTWRTKHTATLYCNIAKAGTTAEDSRTAWPEAYNLRLAFYLDLEHCAQNMLQSLGVAAISFYEQA